LTAAANVGAPRTHVVSSFQLARLVVTGRGMSCRATVAPPAGDA